MKPTAAARYSFSGLESVGVASLAVAAADVALLVDGRGAIRDVASGSGVLDALEPAHWIGRPFAEVVAPGSRPKVEALLRDAEGSAPASSHVDHPSPQGDVPVRYTAIRTGPTGAVIAIGRDLRPIARMQRHLVTVQQALEREQSRRDQVEIRCRALFHAVPQPVLIVEATTMRIVEANPAASRALDDAGGRLVGRPIVECFDIGGRSDLHALIDRARASPDPREARLRLRPGGPELPVAMTTFREDASTMLLVRIGTPATESDHTAPLHRALLGAVERAPDGIVVTDGAGRVLYANAGFAGLVRLDAAERAVGEVLDRWLGRSGTELGVLISALRQSGSVRLFPTVLRGRFGVETPVEVSAAAVPGDAPRLAFTIRDVGRRWSVEGAGERGLGTAVDRLAELVGHAPMKEIVGTTVDLIERRCIEAALHLTRNNRAAAAEMLGLSRQSLYVKLRRFGMDDPGPTEDGH
ncbi:MAG TPA: transcriptional regulator PpsR [Burkholderiaceae bacterium]|nr:transcriptional regulator PpsR [Burkholderiaceae bacterium]